ncbi:hypothetical protein KUCAC02_000511 [Chaenocephalus aceratus]|uniref:Uncharacterized protein n=1 Tax=Chaenocephalus aceratus TaxID=36190 RepID=A0ACB9W5S3_CHAAC|nr:hypothetical protein KUCAC02_000511 [Chaenocephalus aceratus]
MLPSPTGLCQTSSHAWSLVWAPASPKPGANGALSQFEATKGVLEQVRPFYKKANIPMVSDKRACHKMVDLVNANSKLRKISQAKRSSETTAKQLEKMQT